MSTSPTITDPPDRPTTGPLVIGPIRCGWQKHEPNWRFWAVLVGPMATALVLGFLEREIDSRLGARVAASLVVVLMLSAMVGFLISVFRSTSWEDAYWRIDDQGVSLIRSGGCTTFLPWDDVEQVYRPDCSLRGRGVKVGFRSNIPEDDRREIEHRIRARLKDDFDLDLPRASFGSFFWLLATSLTWTAAFFATVAGPIMIDALGGPRIGWIGATAALGWPVLAVVLVLRKLQRFKEENWVSRHSGDPRSGVPAIE